MFMTVSKNKSSYGWVLYWSGSYFMAAFLDFVIVYLSHSFVKMNKLGSSIGNKREKTHV